MRKDSIENAASHPIILFDGVCNLCNGSINLILKWDAGDNGGVFRFATLQSEAGKAQLEKFGLEKRSMTSIGLLEGGRYFEKSEAALRILRNLGWPFKALYPLMLLPRPLREAGYDLIARNRYRIFGRRETCMMPTPEIRARFL
jgi:predicted DCC family thiol-disulfide oxidoreductase YuxK